MLFCFNKLLSRLLMFYTIQYEIQYMNIKTLFSSDIFVRNILKVYVLSTFCWPFGLTRITDKTFLFVLHLLKKINTENERKMPPAQTSIGMSFHAVTYRRAEEKKKQEKKDIIEQTYDCTFPVSGGQTSGTWLKLFVLQIPWGACLFIIDHQPELQAIGYQQSALLNHILAKENGTYRHTVCC